MDVKVREVGNSLTLTIPKNIALKNGIKKNDTMFVYIKNNKLVFEKKTRAKNKLERRLENFYGKPIDEIGVIDNSEADYGYDVGGEIIT